MGALFCVGVGESPGVYSQKNLPTQTGLPNSGNTASQLPYDMQLPRNEQGKLCILYVVAKAKSLRTGTWVFRGILTSPAPVLQRPHLRIFHL